VAVTRRIGLALGALLCAATLGLGSGQGAIAPPWCGTPEPDAAENLPSAGPGNFPHIPY
jgi:hypothetical protein